MNNDEILIFMKGLTIMRIELVQVLKTKDANNGVKSIHKYIDSDIKPNIGDKVVGDDLWGYNKECEVQYVMLYLRENTVRVILKEYVANSDEELNRIIDNATNNYKWEKGGLTF